MRNVIPYLAILISVSCSSPPQSGSDLEFAHYKESSLVSSILGRMEIIDQDVERDFDSLDVCVERGNKHISDESFLLEVKLAYAMWLDEAGMANQTNWHRLKFGLHDTCDWKDTEFSSIIAVAHPDKESKKSESHADAFNELNIDCNKTKDNENGQIMTRWSCKGKTATYGHGSPGGIGRSVWRRTGPDKWASVSNSTPALVALNAHIDWISVDEDLKQNDVISSKTRTDLLKLYSSLASTGEPTLAQLKEFGRSLRKGGVLLSKDPVFRKTMKEFGESTAMQSSQTYRPRVGLFNVLLHEVGHQFGMLHADNPSKDTVTGKSLTAVKNSEGEWITDQSAMAYADDYLYLLEDDSAGVKNALETVRAHIKKSIE